MRWIVGLCTVVVLTGVLYAAVGDLTPVAVEPGEALQIVGLSGLPNSFTKPTPGDGTVSPRATVVVLKSASPPGISVKAAIDSQSPDAKAPDVVRLNFAGSGGFEGNPAIPLSGRKEGPVFSGKLKPTTIQVQRDGKVIPVTIDGHYTKQPGYRYLVLRAGTALAGKCRFGEKVYDVRVVDGNANLTCGDKTTPRAAMGSNRSPGRGDTLVVDYGGSISRSFYGHPALVDGLWYDVKLSEDGAKISATPADIKTATLKIPNDNWSLRLAGKKHVLTVSGSDKPVTIPADTYTMVQFAQDAKDDDGKESWLVFDARWVSKKRIFKASPGQTVELAVGTPLTAKVECKVHGRAVSMNLKIVDASGEEGDYLVKSESGRPDPKMEVFDAEGKKVYSGNFEYG